MRTRGRSCREDRLVVDPGVLGDLYLGAALPAVDVGKMLGVSHRVVLRSAHDHGLPVRTGGAVPRCGPADIELIRALYADPDVRRTLARYGVPPVTGVGPIWRRFPVPVGLSAELAAELYESCGLATTHIELLTGQPAASVRRLLHRTGVRLRTAGGRSPFLRKWRMDAST